MATLLIRCSDESLRTAEGVRVEKGNLIGWGRLSSRGKNSEQIRETVTQHFGEPNIYYIAASDGNDVIDVYKYQHQSSEKAASV